MLINKTEQLVVVRYNGKDIEVEPGGKLDVRDFDVANKDIKGAEKHIMLKRPGILDITDQKNDGAVSKESQAELKELKGQLKDTQKELKEVRETLKNVSEKHESSVGEIATAKKDLLSMKKEYDRILKVNKDLEQEVEGLRLQLGTGKKK